ncbi:MAG: triose-phosphate isomerase [Alphaproteobacteria bacterium]|nr:triose-phosphate isomerase [Alphaproteobacteria bacterium]
MTTQPLIIANWKMNGSAPLLESMLQALAPLASRAFIVVCPPATLLAAAARLAQPLGIAIGGQDCHEQTDGAYTGDISAGMLKEAGARYVILGHSERRQHHHETNEIVRKKAIKAIRSGLKPIICVGETLRQREEGLAESVVDAQLWESIPEEAAPGDFLLAYEPVWAIGSGITATKADIEAMHALVVRVVVKKCGGAVPVVYGGSVKAENAKEILGSSHVAGVLVGGASLKVEEFVRIVSMN